MTYVLIEKVSEPSNRDPFKIYLKGEEYRVGRRTHNFLTRFPFLSREHAAFLRSDSDTLFLKDLGSANGTFLNGVQIGKGLKTLNVGDTIGFGGSEGPNAVIYILCKDGVKQEVIDLTEDEVDVVADSHMSSKTDEQTLVNYNEHLCKEKLSENCVPNEKNGLALNAVDLSDSTSAINMVASISKSQNSSSNIIDISDLCSDFTVSKKITQASKEFSRVEEKPLENGVPSKRNSISKSQNSSSNVIDISELCSDFTGTKKITHASKEFSRVEEKPLENGVQSKRNDLSLNEVNKFESASSTIQHSIYCSHSVSSNKIDLPEPTSSFTDSAQIVMMESKKESIVHRKKLQVKPCSVYLVKIDPDHFKQPSDIQNSCRKRKREQKIENKDAVVQKSKKKVTILSSDSSDDSDNELPSISSLFENYAAEADEEVCYSQVEEIITISDDEAYLDFKSSENYVHVKQETLDEMEVDLCREIFGNETESIDRDLNLVQEQDDNTESIDSIRKFVKATEEQAKSSNELTKNNLDLQLDSSAESISNDEKSKTLCTTRIRVGSHDANNSSKSEISQTKNKLTNLSGSSPKGCKIVKKSIGRTICIDPKPMTQRPCKFRGRKEGFTERQDCVKQNMKAKTRVNESPSKNKKINSNRSLASKAVTASASSNIKNFKIPRLSKVENHKNTSNDKVDSSKNASNLGHSSLVDNIKKKAPTVKIRCDKFSSRSAFLINDRETSTVKQTAGKTKITSSLERNKCNMGNKANISCPPLVSSFQGTFKHKDNKQFINNNPQDVEMKLRKGDQTAIQTELSSIHKKFKASVEKEHNSCPTPNPYLEDTAKNNYTQTNSIISQTFNRTSIVSDPRLSRQVGRNSSMPNNAVILKPHQAHNIRVSEPNSEVTSSRRYFTRNHSEPSYLKLVKEILKLQPTWLEEQAKIKNPPPLVSEGAADLPIHFKSYDHYVSLFYPMIMLEIWGYMFTESKEVFKSKKIRNRFYFSLISYTSKDDCIELKCESIVNERNCYSPREGSLVVMDIKVNSTICQPFFGYIFRHDIKHLDLNYIKNSQWKSFPKDWVTNAKHWTFNVYIKKKEVAFALGCVLKGNGICYLRSKLRQIEALSEMKNSTLMDIIIQPKPAAFTIKYPESPSTREYTASQMKAINGIYTEIEKPSFEPKIILVQGPPGTGKTHTVIGLLEKLVIEGKTKKILVVAPSNAAIDEIGCRLIDLNQQSSWRTSINIVRIGSEAQVNKKILPYFIDKKARELHKQGTQTDFKLKEKDIENLKTEISRVDKQVANSATHERLRYLKDRLRNLEDSQNTEKKLDYKTLMSLKETVLKDCHIVLSTLNSSLNTRSPLRKIFKLNSKVHFSCCIMDESTQCTEVEVLQPLIFGINKFILFGDHEQLPATVNSNLARQHGFERSMFERLNLVFDRHFKCNPTFMLTEQFRMHSKICEFPSKHIYSERLQTDPRTDIRYKNFPLKPYIVLDIGNSQESNESSSKLNCAEASAIVNICQCLLDVIDMPSSIGIISFYSGQRLLYENSLHQNRRYRDIEINTVDGFQGREKEVIILSCVRANSESGGIGFVANRNRLNVAITRAKKCLIICCHVDSMRQNPDWRALLDDARHRKVCFHAHSSKDIPLIFEKYIKKD